MPDGWQLLEQQQDRFALGGITAAATAIGGSPTHSHTLNGSTQPDGGHSHGSFDGSFGVYDGWGRGGRPAFGIIDRNGRNAPSLRTSGPDGIHTHTFAATTSTVSNIPDFIKLPFIASNRDKTMIPERAIIACRTDSLNRPGWLLCDGQNGTPDLRDRFVRGSNTGFGETGAASSTTHKHDWSATTSTDGNHCHTSLGDSGCYKRNVDNGGLTAIDTNGRDVPTLNTSSNVVHNHGLTGSTQVAPPLPPFWSVAYFMRQPGAGPIHCLDDLPEGVILMFQGAPEAIPRGWALCDGKDGRLNLVGRFLRGSSAAARPDCPGGADATVHAHAVDETRMVGSGQHSHNTFDPGYGVYMRKIVGGDHRGISVIDANGKNPAAFVTTADGVHGHAVTGVKTAEADSMPPFFAILFLQRTPQQP
ncbi:hypothetical protein Pelo_16606 [Pelomyxa schiedti]|nr:hypothetical protein Pelo_16606 [Pelomyxa schiedti]